MNGQPTIAYVTNLPDLITLEDYRSSNRQKLVRFRLTITDEGIEIIGDSSYPHGLEELLTALSPRTIEMVLCG